MRILVTGANGFVGQHLLQLLARGRHEVLGTVLGQACKSNAQGQQFASCDLRDARQISDIVESFRPQHIYHLAALSSVKDSFADPHSVFDVNFLGTLNLLEAAHAHAPRARILIVGSAQVYGEPKGSAAITEETPLSPQSPYAASKAASDLLAYQYWKAYGMHVIRVRPFNHTGPGQPATFVCSDFAKQVAEIDLGLRGPRISVGNLNVKRDFSDVRDVVRAYQRLLAKGKRGEVYNIASEKQVSIAEILKMLCSFSRVRIKIKVEPGRLRKNDPKSLRASTKKLRSATGWKPEYELRDTLRDLFEQWKSAPSFRPLP
jgi:GDP-4-dehydro-6-deoxy-D-mannose reductase